MAALSNEEMLAALHQPDPATKDFFYQQTMYRVKDPKASLTFYSKVLGMRLLHRFDFPPLKFSLYFMGYANENEIPKDEAERFKWCMTSKTAIELTHNWGSETDDSVQYHNGNSSPQGFGHIGVCVPDVDAACKRFEELNVPFKLKLNAGKIKGIAFIMDPDGYWIEIFSGTSVTANINKET
ncbi:lactoylglutathione lyase [Octopus sinensis]|uniref:lactoylglutathione lyase n=1 Tax=Octopus sinensis TaxID=2607531 RepID=A0A6P7T9I0_9MOLL|nr:lactoylglutathione lyase [Octopus sinensis]XP_036366852.1 lactoylglutathione lyase [Octopus sinensis]